MGKVCIFFGTTHFILERCVWGSNHKIFIRRGTDVLGKMKKSTCNILTLLYLFGNSDYECYIGLRVTEMKQP